MAGPDIECPSGEIRAAGLLCFQNEFSEIVWYGLTRLYYKAFAETKPACGPRSKRRSMDNEFAAYVAIDWADQKHAWARSDCGLRSRAESELTSCCASLRSPGMGA